jgi:SWI/SNF-related matrix-associated actin-dependent regulator of chromatin subfamily A-like protein 1
MGAAPTLGWYNSGMRETGIETPELRRLTERGPQITYNADLEVIEVRTPINRAASHELRACNIKWTFGHYQVRPALVGPLMAWAAKYGYTASAEVRALENGYRRRAEVLRTLSGATEAPPLAVVPPHLSLHDFQAASATYAVQASRTFIADQPGLGKTITALMALESRGAWPAVVVSPAIYRQGWLREAAKWLPHRTARVVYGRGKGESLPPTDLIILSYDVAAGRADALIALAPGALVLDECHMSKSAHAARTKACRRIARVIPESGLVLMLSGTPLLNRPAELAAQLDILGYLPAWGGKEHFKKRYCGAYGKGSQNLDELSHRLRGECYVRHRKEDVLKELPPKTWSIVKIEDLNLKEYDEAYSDVVMKLAAQAKDVELKARTMHQLAELEYLKQYAVRAKLPEVKKWIDDFLTSDAKLVIMAHHRDVVDALATHFKAPRIQGGMTEKARGEAEKRFQTDPTCQLLVCSIEAAGVAITLTAASDVLFLELPWTPAKLDQAADRLHRIGQPSAVTAWVMIGVGTIDEPIMELLDRKREVIDAVTDGGRDDDGASIVEELVERLVG